MPSENTSTPATWSAVLVYTGSSVLLSLSVVATWSVLMVGGRDGEREKEREKGREIGREGKKEGVSGLVSVVVVVS